MNNGVIRSEPDEVVFCAVGSEFVGYGKSYAIIQSHNCTRFNCKFIINSNILFNNVMMIGFENCGEGDVGGDDGFGLVWSWVACGPRTALEVNLWERVVRGLFC